MEEVELQVDEPKVEEEELVVNTDVTVSFVVSAAEYAELQAALQPDLGAEMLHRAREIAARVKWENALSHLVRAKVNGKLQNVAAAFAEGGALHETQ